LEVFQNYTAFEHGHVMSQNFTGWDEEIEETGTRLVVDFSIFFIVGPVFLMFCIFLLWWDFFYGARVVPKYCLYFTNQRQSQPQSKATSHVEIYTSSRMSLSGSPKEDTIIHHVQTFKNLKVAHEMHNKATVVVSHSPSLPMLLDHKLDDYRGETSPGREQQPVTMNYRDPSLEKTVKPKKKTYARKKHPRKKAVMKNSDVQLSKLSAERRAMPMWEKKYSNSRPVQNGSSSDASESTFLKARSDETLYKRLSEYFPPDALIFQRQSTTSSQKPMRKTQSCNVLLKRRLSEFIPAEDLTMDTSESMVKSVTCPVEKKLKSLEEYVPQHTPSLPHGSKDPGETSEGHTTSASLQALQFDLSQIEEKLKNELRAVDLKIEKYKQRKSPTKQEMQANLEIFIPDLSIGPPPGSPELLETLTVKSDRSPVSIARMASHNINHHRAKSWQSKTYNTTTLYE